MVLLPDRPRLLLPGLKAPDPFLETYLVRPGGASESFLTGRDAVVVIAQPLGPSVVEGGAPQSDLIVEVRRTAPRSADGDAELPPPLAEPRLDFRVDRATALSYEVRAGEYI